MQVWGFAARKMRSKPLRRVERMGIDPPVAFVRSASRHLYPVNTVAEREEQVQNRA